MVNRDRQPAGNIITSRHNPRVKRAMRLRRRREREEQCRFLIDGAREIERAIAAGVSCHEAYVCDELCTSPAGRDALRAVQSAAAEVVHVTREVYAKLAFGERLDGLVVVANTPRRQLLDVQLSPCPIVAVLEGIEKPGNVGAILRTADAVGADAVIVADGRTDLYNSNTIRASLGTVFRANVCTATTAETIAWLQRHDVPMLAARPDASTVYTSCDMRRGIAIVLGNEAAGLSEAWRSTHVVSARLPMHGLADSLNVSTTAAVLLYEALRQRGELPGMNPSDQ